MKILIQTQTNHSIYILLLFIILPSVFSAQTGDKCNSTITPYQPDDCPYLHTCQKGVCLHKFVWPPEPEEIAGSILLFIVIGMGTAGGIGGVFLIRPILVYLFNYSTEAASQLSYAVLFGGMFGGCVQRIWKREPGTERPVIHYEVALVAIPIIMFGANLGTLLNRVLPTFIDFSIQMYLLVTTTMMMWQNHKNQKSKENRMKIPQINL